MSTKTTTDNAKAEAAAAKAAAAKLTKDSKAVFAARNPKGKNAVPASWAAIGAKLGVSAATARRLYDVATGVPGSFHASRIPGKGGRTVAVKAEAAEAVAA
jgi:hypothetical protein